LKECFGCLASSVAFLHSKDVAIKHKDIKPSNFLMFQSTPILTDFRISNSFKNQEHSTSSGFTKRSSPYAAPEAIAQIKRNTSQDIFSLGLVFLDMFWALRGKAHIRSDFNGDLREEPFQGHHLNGDDIHFAGGMVESAYVQSPTFQKPDILLKIIRLITAVKLEQRPTADNIWNVFTNPTCFGQTCGDCCLSSRVLETTTFTEWTGLCTYVPSRSRGPFDEDSRHDTTSEHQTLLSRNNNVVVDIHPESTPALPSDFDWSEQNRDFHIDFRDKEEIMLPHVGMLGNGYSGFVESVICNGKLLARKTIPIRRRQNRAKINRIFKAEIAVMRKLRHRHILQAIQQSHL
jgi:serine/threonine protein kinase